MPNQQQQTKRQAKDPVLLCIGLDKLDQNLRVDWLPVFKAVHCGPRAHGVSQVARNAQADAIAVGCNSWADVEYVKGLRNDGVSIPILLVASEEMSASIPSELKCAAIFMTRHDRKDLPAAFEGAMATAYAHLKPVEE